MKRLHVQNVRTFPKFLATVRSFRSPSVHIIVTVEQFSASLISTVVPLTWWYCSSFLSRSKLTANMVRRVTLSGWIAASILFPSAAQECPVSTLVWADEFDGNALDATKWEPMIGDGCSLGICGWGNNELEYYTDREDNLKVENGLLKIIARQEDYQGKQYTSARIRTLGLFDADLGAGQNLRLEARLKVPPGKGLWPAFWMLPSQQALNTWPRYGEIDIMEWIGREPNFVSRTADVAF